jgi:hypothetical protein
MPQVIKCCNPKCEALFDHGEGQLVPFSDALTNAKTLETRSLFSIFGFMESVLRISSLAFQSCGEPRLSGTTSASIIETSSLRWQRHSLHHNQDIRPVQCN